MTRQPHKYRPHIVSILLLLCSVSTLADDQTTGLYQKLSGTSLASSLFSNDGDINIGGWATGGFTYNFDSPKTNNNGPVAFNYRANELDLYQLDVFIERQTKKGNAWDFGGHIDVMFGTDTPYTQATGHWDMGLINKRKLRLYDLALPQVYTEVYTPLGNGLTTKIGHFYSIIGYESVASPPNFFLSHTYSMKSSPFTVTGALTSYAINDNFGIQVGAVTGPDNFDKSLGAWSFMGGFTWDSDNKATGFSFSSMNGATDDTRSSNLSYYTAVFHHNLTPKLHYVLQHDRGFQHHALDAQDAEWYSIVQYLTYDISETWGAGVRGEWFRDDGGVRFNNGSANYYALSAGFNWKPESWLILRPEIRFDQADSPIKPFNGGQKADQLLLGLDATVRF